MFRPTILITGALTGIGRATAAAFAQEGANVAISGRDTENGSLLLKELLEYRIEAEFILTDVRCDEDVRNMVDWTVSRFGSLDVAVNNADTEGKPGFIVDQTVESFNDIFETNVLGTLLSLKYELRRMMRQKSGVIINVSSIYGQRGVIGAGVYAASKHAVEGLTKAAALEAAEAGVRVNAVAPGLIDTDLLVHLADTAGKKSALIKSVPLQRLGRAEEIAQTIVFLASAKAAFITGQIFAVDGGKMAS
jgi:NAD(P)-dependent dehydrogenase (short-subunit alcohol dehydrogenase family)